MRKLKERSGAIPISVCHVHSTRWPRPARSWQATLPPSESKGSYRIEFELTQTTSRNQKVVAANCADSPSGLVGRLKPHTQGTHTIVEATVGDSQNRRLLGQSQNTLTSEATTSRHTIYPLHARAHQLSVDPPGRSLPAKWSPASETYRYSKSSLNRLCCSGGILFSASATA